MTVDTEISEQIEQTDVDTSLTIESLQKDLEAKTKLIEKLRANEKHNQQVAKEVGAKNLEDALKALQNGYTKDVEEWKTKFSTIESEYNSLKDSIKQEKTDNILKEILSKSNAKDINTVLKIIDKSAIQYNEDGNVDTKSIDNIVIELKKTDPVLFNEVSLPDVKTASNGTPVGSYETELKSAKSQTEIIAIMKKYNKI